MQSLIEKGHKLPTRNKKMETWMESSRALIDILNSIMIVDYLDPCTSYQLKRFHNEN